MIRVINGKVIPVCDICGVMLHDNQDLRGSYFDMTKNGWLNGRIGTKWVNWCDSCTREAVRYMQEDFFDLSKKPLVLVEAPSGDEYLKGRVLQEGRKENIPGVAEGSMAEFYLMSVDPDDEMGGW